MTLIKSVEGLKDMDLLVRGGKILKAAFRSEQQLSFLQSSLQLTLPIPDLAVPSSLLFYPYAQSICSSDPQLIDPSSFC